MRSRVRTLLVLVALATLLTGRCTSSGDRTRSDATDQGEVRPGGTLTYATAQKITGFNQLSANSASLALYNIMVKVWPAAFTGTPDGGVVLNRDLLESAELTSTEPQTVVYKLNPRATWSDGDPIDAKDFVYLWRTAYTQGAKDVDGSVIATTTTAVHGVLQSVTASDDGRTATVVFARRYPDWRSLFSFLVPAHIAERVGWNHGFDAFDGAAIVSGGPFRVSGHRPDQDVTLVRNERYWGVPAMLDSIVVRHVPDPGQLLAALRNGEVDLVDITSPSVDALSQARALTGTKTVVYRQDRYERLYFNMRSGHLGLADVRRAIVHGIDRDGLLARGNAQLAPEQAGLTNNRLYTPNETGYGDTRRGRYERHDPEAAKRLLEGAGFRLGGDGIYGRDGKRLSLRLPSSPALNATAELLQAQLRQIGAEVRIEQMANPLEALRKGQFDMGLGGRPTQPAARAAETSQFMTDGGFNLGRYSSPAVDDLLRQANSELDDVRRHELHRRADEVMWDDLPTLPLQQTIAVLVHRDRFLHIEPDTDGGISVTADRWATRAAG